jgi:DNA-binding SARP family transcriptional activator
MRTSQFAAVEEGASRFLAADDGADPVTTARALSALARAVCWRTDREGRRDVTAMRRSDGYFARAAELYRAAGLRTSEAAMAPYRAMWIDYALGDARAALERLDEGLGLVVDRPRKRAFLLLFRAEVLTELGRYEEAEADYTEAQRIGEHHADEQLQGFGYWGQAIVASHVGAADRVVERVRMAEQHRGEWFEPLAGDFLGDSADQLDRVGHTALAWEYLRRAQANPMDGEAMIAMAELALLARHGDPIEAEAKALEVWSHRVDPREGWRVTLFRAYAAFRRGDRGAGALAARAFEEAGRLGLDQLPLTKERELTEQLLGLAAETGQPASLALQRVALPMSVTVLGHFALARGGRPVGLPAGQGAQLLKLLAVCGGRLPTDRAIDALWPDADLDAGRNRLRTVLNRLRSDGGEVVGRDGEVLALHPDVRVDLVQFEQEARRALALGADEPALAVAVARSALARYRGDLLPDDLYEPWAERPRDQARRIALELLDLCADVAAHRGDLDEVRRLVEATIDLAPYDDARYLRAATALLHQGRAGAALAVVARSRAALAELGVPPSPQLEELERAIVGSRARA